jgi:hypothetical protein
MLTFKKLNLVRPHGFKKSKPLTFKKRRLFFNTLIEYFILLHWCCNWNNQVLILCVFPTKLWTLSSGYVPTNTKYVSDSDIIGSTSLHTVDCQWCNRKCLRGSIFWHQVVAEVIMLAKNPKCRFPFFCL